MIREKPPLVEKFARNGAEVGRFGAMEMTHDPSTILLIGWDLADKVGMDPMAVGFEDGRFRIDLKKTDREKIRAFTDELRRLENNDSSNKFYGSDGDL